MEAQQVAEKIGQITGYAPGTVLKVFDGLKQVIDYEVKRGGSVMIAGLGAFRAKVQKGRASTVQRGPVRIPITIPTRRKLTFVAKPGKRYL